MIRRLEPLSWLLMAVAAWALVCVAIALGGFGGQARPLPDNPGLAQKLPAVPKSAAHSALGALEVYAEAYNHPLFFPDRKPAAAHVPGKSGDSDHPLDVVLTSVVMTPTLQMAIVQDPKTHQSLRVREGQPVGGAYNAWKLTGLSPRTATFDSDSQGQSTLNLRIFDGKGGEEPTRMGLTPQAVAAGVLGNLALRSPSPPEAADPPTESDKDNSQPDQPDAQASASSDADTPDASQVAANAAANAAQQQAEEIRHRIEQRRQQALSRRQANEKER